MQFFKSLKLLLLLTCLQFYLNLGSSLSAEEKRADYYEYRHVVADGVQKALDECREKFKWDRWNCPKKAFLDILDRNPIPSNKEFGLTHALIASGIVLSLARSCSYGSNNVCGCSHTASLAARAAGIPGSIDHLSGTTMVAPSSYQYQDPSDPARGASAISDNNEPTVRSSKFVWRGCDEIVKFAFKVSKKYLNFQDVNQDEANRRVNAHNFEVGRLAVKKNMKKVCKCHGMSGSCQVNTCWNSVPDMNKVGEYLRHQYRLAAKVGAMSAEDTNVDNLNKELKAISPEKLVFVDASPDYCYENPKLGINGTLNRYCSRAKTTADGFEVSRSERDSCNRLCTKCGYRVKREVISLEKQCDCRFVYCCKVECRRCTHVESTYRCVRHS